MSSSRRSEFVWNDSRSAEGLECPGIGIVNTSPWLLIPGKILMSLSEREREVKIERDRERDREIERQERGQKE
jgi:hypothetical protein